MVAEISRRRALQALAVLAGAGAAVATTDEDSPGGMVPVGGTGGSAGEKRSYTVYRADSYEAVQSASEPGIALVVGDRPGIVAGNVMTATKASPAYYEADSYPIDESSIDTRPALVLVTGDQGGITYIE